MTLIIVNVCLLLVFFGLSRIESGSGFGIGGAMGDAIMQMFVYPIVLTLINIVLCFIFYDPSPYFFFALLPLALPAWVLFSEYSERSRYSKMYLKHAPIIQLIITDLLQKYGIDTKQRSNIGIKNHTYTKVSTDLRVEVHVFTKNATNEQKEALETELKQSVHALFKPDSYIIVS
jgi:hypothetical protein